MRRICLTKKISLTLISSLIHTALWVLLVLPVYSQQNKLTFQSLQDGLSHHQIKCIVKDSKGFMWFGTQDGLNKFDGTNIVVYENDPKDTNSLCHNSVNAIIEDRYKNLWIGTSNGINLYSREKDNFTGIENFGKRDILYVSALYSDKHGMLWIGTSGNGLFLYDPENLKLSSYLHDKTDNGSLTSNFISCIISDDEDNVWVGTRDGLNLFKKESNSFIHFVHDPANPESLSNNSVSDLTLDNDGILWIGTYGGGINRLVRVKNRYTFIQYLKSNKNGSISHNNILSLCADRKGNLWIGTENGGLNFLGHDTDQFICFQANDGIPNGLSSNSIWSIYEDNIGIMWIGTYSKGVNIIDDNYEKFTLIQKNVYATNTLVDNNVKGFAEDDRGNLWIATDGGGLCYFNTKTRLFENRFDNSVLSSKALMTILYDSRQNIWVGTWAGGIERFVRSGQKIRNYTHKHFPGPTNNVISIYEDKRGDIWAGTSGGGLFIYDPLSDGFSRVTEPDGDSLLTTTAFINTILEDSFGNIWFGTLFGLVCLTRTAVNSYTFSDYLYSSEPGRISSFRITVLFEDSRKNLWIGTEDGLNLFNRYDTTFIVYQKQNGLPNNTINGILEDKSENLWISTNEGISKFDPVTLKFTNFTKEDGLNTNEFNIRSCIKTRTGEFYFGGNNGLNAFYPDSIRINENVPPVYLTNFMIFNNPVEIAAKGSPLTKTISETDRIDLAWNQNSFTIEFVALNYTRSARNQYAYFLEGFEKTWNYVGTRRRATYTNLDPGKYVFKVRGSNNDGLWNNTPVRLEINILPPYWKTFWAYLVYLIFLSLLLTSFIRLLTIRARQAQQLKLEKIQREKDEELNELKISFFTNISHELRTPLSLILSPLQQIISQEQLQSKLLNQLKLVFRNAERLFRLVNELMDFAKSEKNRLKIMVRMADIVKFTHDVFFLFSDEAHRRGIEYQFIAGMERIDAWFDENKLEKIILNLISNAFKFTPDKGRIIVHVGKTVNWESDQWPDNSGSHSYANECVFVSVTDNGPGIAPQYLDKIFERYFQSPEEHRKSHTGSGIGLALVKNLVELHQGSIRVTSEKWKETCFKVILPLGNSHFRENEIITATKSSNQSAADNSNFVAEYPEQLKSLPEILIVEDNEELRKYMASELSENYRILEAADGEAGYELASEHIPDLIISDIIMPRINGTELCRKIRENMSTSHIPVILLTSKTEIEDKIEGIEKGADAYITKPFNLNYVGVTIRNMIETRRKLYKRFSQEVYILPKEISKNALDQKFLERTIEYINKHVENEEITVENLASYLIMNRSNVYRKIKALTGQTATEFIRLVRLKMAIKYLESGEYNISEIALKVGFESPGYFAKCFKTHFGKSPSEFLSDKLKNRSGTGA